MQNDWFMEQIEMMTRFLGKVLFHKDLAPEEFQLVDAQSLIFDEIEKEASPRMLKIACDFYGALAQMEESRLAAADFSREEVAQGIRDIEDLYGIGQLESM